MKFGELKITVDVDESMRFLQDHLWLVNLLSALETRGARDLQLRYRRARDLEERDIVNFCIAIEEFKRAFEN